MSSKHHLICIRTSLFPCKYDSIKQRQKGQNLLLKVAHDIVSTTRAGFITFQPSE